MKSPCNKRAKNVSCAVEKMTRMQSRGRQRQRQKQSRTRHGAATPDQINKPQLGELKSENAALQRAWKPESGSPGVRQGARLCSADQRSGSRAVRSRVGACRAVADAASIGTRNGTDQVRDTGQRTAARGRTEATQLHTALQTAITPTSRYRRRLELTERWCRRRTPCCSCRTGSSHH